MEDLDGPRTVAAAVNGNLDELRWLGLDWDEGPDVGGPHAPYRQSERGARYTDALSALADRGLLAEDWLSRRDLAEAASAPHAEAPLYGPRERALSASLAAERRAAGRAPAVRARLGELALTAVTVRDRYLGVRTADLGEEVGDVVVRRSDGLWAYHLAVVVDDAAMGINEVVRGADLWSATPIQAALALALGIATPAYAHVPLLLDANGERMAKRRGGGTLAQLRAEGASPERLLGALAVTLGWWPTPRPLSPQGALAAFGVHGVGRGTGRWSDDLDRWLRGI